MDQGGDNDESDRALGIRGENVSGETGAADDMAARQGSGDDGDGGGGGMAVMEIPNQSRMSRTQRKNFKRAAKRIQGRK